MKKIVFIFFLIATILAYYACDSNDTSVENKYNELYGSLKKDFEAWDTLNNNQKIAILCEPNYIGYNPRDLSLLGFITGDETYFNIVKDIISIYKNHFIVNGILRHLSTSADSPWYRDQFARDNNLLYETYVYTKYLPILNIIEQQVALWLEKVPRSEHNGFLLFPYGISRDNEILSYEIDPNQNLQVATLFSNLYFEPNSKYYKDDFFKEIAYNEVNAVVAIQKANGSLPIREYLPLAEDSNYGGFAGDLLYQLSQIWGERAWIESTIKIGVWLHRDFSEEHPWNLPEDFPNYASNKNWNSFNLVGRILPFYAAGISNSYISKWISYIKSTFPDDELNMGSRWYFYQSIPRSYLTEQPIPQKLKPFIYADDIDNNKINIRIIAEKIDIVELIISDNNGTIICHEKFIDDKPIEKTIPLKGGSYSYTILVDGNKNQNSVKGLFILKAQNSVTFNILLFDKYNTFQDVVS